MPFSPSDILLINGSDRIAIVHQTTLSYSAVRSPGNSKQATRIRDFVSLAINFGRVCLYISIYVFSSMLYILSDFIFSYFSNEYFFPLTNVWQIHLFSIVRSEINNLQEKFLSLETIMLHYSNYYALCFYIYFF